MSIVTKTGDSGTTRLIFGERVSKADLQVEAYGAIDELNAFLGWARACCDDEKTRVVIEKIQRETFVLAAELATPVERLESLRNRVVPSMTQDMEAIVAEIEAIPGLLDDWALPGATQAGAAIDCARVMARRAERYAVRLNESHGERGEKGEVNPELLRYLNRLSDLLWLLGRRYEIERGIDSALRPEKNKS